MPVEPNLEEILRGVASGELSVEEAQRRLHSERWIELGFAQLDLDRERRTGTPEFVFAEGKATDHLLEIVERLVTARGFVCVTRVSDEQAKALSHRHTSGEYSTVGRVWTLGRPPQPVRGKVAVVSAGTSDLPVAEEASDVATWLGHDVERIVDVGVADIGRVVRRLEDLTTAQVVIVVAGMDGALPTVLAGLCAAPIVAVPTSVGYGASFSGIAPLLTMLSSCAPGLSVVNIDNGFGAAVMAHRIVGQIEKKS